jgi:calcineurin-like phosphoesterase family protein
MIKITQNNDNRTPNIWVFSDPHYGHKNICRGVTEWRTEDGKIPFDQTRDFKTLDQMNDTIVHNINSVVGQDDILICLGDWSFGGFENVEKFWDRLICKNIHLILGNHDHHIERDREDIQKLFLSVSHYETLQVGKYTFRLMHYPISSWDGLNKGVFHLHGHCHLPTHMRFGRGQRMDVGMDGHPEFRPYNLMTEIVPLLKGRPILSEMPEDHHTERLLNSK